ncbi:MAG: ABC transporter ATP-binding protein [Actinomycetota bacterium]|nr:ABC transporter ATP-binding protein [Actinomycetota bacterium]
MAVIEIEGLKKKYRRVRGRSTVALAGLDLAVPAGGVFGFLGPNGAGKTTTVRCLLGLIRPSSGATRLLGVDTQGHLERVIDRVGSIVETPSLFPGFSGRKNLELLGRLEGIGSTAVSETLERVGLGERADHRVKTYSLGMRQRLGIGAALLKDPEVLILDEPANGLDPAGIKEVRDLLRRLGREGRTVFVSSHILGEVRQMCDQVAILARGKCIVAGPVEEVLHDRHEGGFSVKLPDLRRGLEVLQAAGIEAVFDHGFISVKLPPDRGASITETLAREGLFVSELRPLEADLETVFLELTQDPAEEIAR